MKTIHTKNGASLKREHKNISRIVVFMPRTGAISATQTTSFYANLEADFFMDAQNNKFVGVQTIKNEMLMLNTAHIIAIELGDVIELTDGCCYFVKVDEEVNIKDQGNYGTTQADFQI